MLVFLNVRYLLKLRKFKILTFFKDWKGLFKDNVTSRNESNNEETNPFLLYYNFGTEQISWPNSKKIRNYKEEL